jgi:hypothetical protein
MYKNTYEWLLYKYLKNNIYVCIVHCWLIQKLYTRCMVHAQKITVSLSNEMRRLMLAGNRCVCQMKGICLSQPSARTVCLRSFCHKLWNVRGLELRAFGLHINASCNYMGRVVRSLSSYAFLIQAGTNLTLPWHSPLGCSRESVRVPA